MTREDDEVDPHEPDEAPLAEAPRAADVQPAMADGAKEEDGLSATPVEDSATPPIPEAPATTAAPVPDAADAPSAVAPPEAALPAIDDTLPEATLPAIAEMPLGVELTELEKALLAELPAPEALPPGAATPLTRTASSAAP